MSVELADIPSRQRGTRYGSLLFAAGAVVTVVGLVLPHPPEVDEHGLAAVAAGCALVALVMRIGDEQLPGWAYHLVMACGTALISLALLFNGERNGGAAGGDEIYYVCVVLYAAYYFGRRALAVQVALIALAYALTLSLIDPGPIGPSRWVTMTGLVVVTAIVVRLLSERIERLISELAAAARVDRLTGLANRRAFEEQFALESARARRGGQPIGLLLADVDDFKAINDRWGHAAGDAALVVVAEVLSDCTRGGDTPARIGGDEFAVLLPDTDRAGAQEIADRLTHAVAEHRDQAALSLTLSIGVAVQAPEEAALEELMRDADVALYAAKRTGAARTRSRLG